MTDAGWPTRTYIEPAPSASPHTSAESARTSSPRPLRRYVRLASAHRDCPPAAFTVAVPGGTGKLLKLLVPTYHSVPPAPPAGPSPTLRRPPGPRHYRAHRRRAGVVKPADRAVHVRTCERPGEPGRPNPSTICKRVHPSGVESVSAWSPVCMRTYRTGTDSATSGATRPGARLATPRRTPPRAAGRRFVWPVPRQTCCTTRVWRAPGAGDRRPGIAPCSSRHPRMPPTTLRSG